MLQDCKLRLRAPEVEDVPALVAVVCEQQRRSLGYSDPDALRIERKLRKYMEKLHKGERAGRSRRFILIATRGGVPVGFIAGKCRRRWDSNDLAAAVTMFCLQPESRAVAGVRLWKAFSDWAALEGAIEVDVQDGLASAVEQLAGRLGLTPVGRIYRTPLFRG